MAVPLACARAVGVYRSHRKVLISGASPGPGAVTMRLPARAELDHPGGQRRPRTASPGYGVKVENTSAPCPFSAGSVDENTFTCDSMPGPDADDDVVGQRISVDVGACDVHAAGETGVERGEPGQLRLERPCGRVVAVVGDDLGRSAPVPVPTTRSRIMSPFTSAIATDGVPSKSGNGVTVCNDLVAVAVVDLHRCRLAVASRASPPRTSTPRG